MGIRLQIWLEGIVKHPPEPRRLLMALLRRRGADETFIASWCAEVAAMPAIQEHIDRLREDDL